MYYHVNTHQNLIKKDVKIYLNSDFYSGLGKELEWNFQF